jgi:hypothetical protein
LDTKQYAWEESETHKTTLSENFMRRRDHLEDPDIRVDGNTALKLIWKKCNIRE